MRRRTIIVLCVLLLSVAAVALFAVYDPVVPFQIETNVSPWCALRGGPCPLVFPGNDINYQGYKSVTEYYLRYGGVYIDGLGYGFVSG